MPGAPDTRRGRPAGTPDTLQNDHRHEVTHQGSRDTGRLAVICDDPDGAAQVLAEMHGGQRRAAHWLRGVLARLERQGWS